jgi:hypothetical protein
VLMCKLCQLHAREVVIDYEATTAWAPRPSP